jgi:hypothetical protein
MANDKRLVPLFMPPLALVLATAERKKGSPLTAEEVTAIRDKSHGIMMEPADAAKMDNSRGYIDVNPENCWVDWHRLRVQMTGKGCLPKIVLCVPGDDEFRARCQPILEAERIEHEFAPHNPAMVEAFRASSMTRPVFTDEDYRRIERHTTVLYVLSKNFTAAGAPEVGHTFLNLGRRLLEAGGIAIKSESSGISHSPGRWSMLADHASGPPENLWAALLDAYVVLPIASETDFYSCGMHLLGAPDLAIAQDATQTDSTTGESTVSAAIQLFRSFALYLLSECPVGRFGSGHTFSTARDTPRYRILWEPCRAYAEDDFFFNPFGYWRFTAI